MSAEIIQFVPKHIRVKPLEEHLPGTKLIEQMNSAGYSEPQYDASKSLVVDETALRAFLDTDIVYGPSRLHHDDVAGVIVDDEQFCMELDDTWDDADITHYHKGEPIFIGDGSKEPA